MSATIIGGKGKEKRRELDFYPTPIECTIALMDFLKLPKKYFIWEPACGEGDISKALEMYGHKVFSSELRSNTEYECRGGIDFLKHPNINADAIITNPPFNVADEFIKRAVTFSPVVCMLLKSQYWHAKKRRLFFNEYKPSYILPLTWRPDFSGGGSSMMDVIWTVWVEGNVGAKYQPLEKPDISYLF